MSKRRGDGWDDEGGGILGAYVVGGPVLAGVYGVSRALREGERPADDGGAPIGSDPWLRAEVRRALVKAKLPPGTIEVDVREMVVTLEGEVADADAEQRALEAARGVEGVSSVRSLLTRAR